jgi:feruloyl esterase
MYSGHPADSGTPTQPGIAWIQNFLYNDTTWDWHDFTYQVILDADRINPGQANVGFDFTGFYNRGGKIIQYHGLADGLIPTPSSELLYKNIWRTMGAAGIAPDDWYRLFLIPGMQHCQGTAVDAPWYIASGGQPFELGPEVWSVPGYSDAKHDALLALLEWRENGTAPESIIATKFNNDTVTAGIRRQRPICMFPKQAKYTGKGDSDIADNWHCQLPY